jgi:hypothetical protein
MSAIVSGPGLDPAPNAIRLKVAIGYSHFMSTPQELPEVWLRGRIEGFDPIVMPVVHTLFQVREDIERLAIDVPQEHVWISLGRAATIGFHIRHTGGALDRLFTYARGDALSAVQMAALRREGDPGDPPATLGTIVIEVNRIIDGALDQLRATSGDRLLLERRVGRAGLPSNVLGLMFHAAEHSTRHVGQAITTARMLDGPA